MSKIQTSEEFFNWMMDERNTGEIAAIADRDAQIRAEAADEAKIACRDAVIDKLKGCLLCPEITEQLDSILGYPAFQPAKPPRDPRALEVAEKWLGDSRTTQFCHVDQLKEELADLLAANVKEWREK